jgi:Mg2+/citrate symporter
VRYLPTPLGIALLVAGLCVIASPLVTFLIIGGTFVVLGLGIAVAVQRRKRSGGATRKTPEEELSAWQRFVANRRRWAPWESACYVAIAAAFILIDGLTLGTILIAAGFGLLLVARWVIEPRTWDDIARRLAGP